MGLAHVSCIVDNCRGQQAIELDDLIISVMAAYVYPAFYESSAPIPPPFSMEGDPDWSRFLSTRIA